MSNRNYQKAPQMLNPTVRMIGGSFAPNGSSAIDATTRLGLGWSVGYTSTGLYTITFTDKFPNLLCALASLQLTTGDDKFLQVGVYSAANKTLQIRCYDASGAALADAGAGRIHFMCWFSDTTVTPVYGA